MKWRASRWARALGLPALAAAMDAAWIAPWALLLGAAWGRPGSALLAPLSLLGLLVAAQLLTRRLLAGPEAAWRVRGLIAGGGVLAAAAAVALQYGGDPWWRTHGTWWQAVDHALVTLRPEVGALLLAVLAWRRGIGVGRSALEYRDIDTLFQWGLVSFLVFAVTTAIAGAAVPPIAAAAGGSIPYLFAFFAASLIALPVARLAAVRENAEAAEQAVAISADWYGLIAGAVAAILAAAVLAGALLVVDLSGVVRLAGRLLDPVVSILFTVIAVPLALLVMGITWVIRQFVHRGGGQPWQLPAPPQWLTDLRHGGGETLSPAAAGAIRWGIVLVILALLLIWLAKAVFGYSRPGRGRTADETRTSVWSWREMRAGWKTRRRGPRQRRPEPGPVGGAAGAVRRAYAEFLGLAAASGRPRARFETPKEFARVAGVVWPDEQPGLARLAAIYERVRYGLAEPPAPDVDDARTVVAVLRRRLDAFDARRRADGREHP